MYNFTQDIHLNLALVKSSFYEEQVKVFTVSEIKSVKLQSVIIKYDVPYPWGGIKGEF